MTNETYTAGWNMPGYLPETDPETFDTESDALDYVLDAVGGHVDGLSQEDGFGSLHLSVIHNRAVNDLRNRGFTNVPMSRSPHDLGLVYWVEQQEG